MGSRIKKSFFLSIPPLKHNPPDQVISIEKKQDNGINIATCNIEGVKTNAPFLQFLCENNDILFVQEHWLWEFQKFDLSSLIKI